MRVENWRAKGVFNDLAQAALLGANKVMADHVADAKRRCPVRKGVSEGTRYREDSYINRSVSFTPSTGSNKNKPVSFVANTWMGRIAGSLKNTIRKVERHDRPGNIRCYAGNTKVFYARFVEYGTSKTKAHPYLRPSFQAIKGTARARIEEEMRKVPEVI
jgi:HK97 gp10 family phage protein